MRLDDLLGDGEAEARPSGRPAARVVQAGEALEDPLLVGGRHAGAVAGQSVVAGWPTATSSSARLEAIGLWSSCDASATKARWRSANLWRRSSMTFMVVASRPTSSSTFGSSTRRDRSRDEKSAT